MKKSQAVLALAAVAMLAGCTTAPVRVAAVQADPLDYAKIAAVDEAALVRGTRVVWINHPKDRK